MTALAEKLFAFHQGLMLGQQSPGPVRAGAACFDIAVAPRAFNNKCLLVIEKIDLRHMDIVDGAVSFLQSRVAVCSRLLAGHHHTFTAGAAADGDRRS